MSDNRKNKITRSGSKQLWSSLGGCGTNLGPSLLWAVCAFTKALPRLVFFDFQDELHKRKKLDAKVLRLSKFKKQKDSEKVSSFSSHFVSLSFYCQLRKEPLVNSKYGGRESRLRMRVLDWNLILSRSNIFLLPYQKCWYSVFRRLAEDKVEGLGPTRTAEMGASCQSLRLPPGDEASTKKF